MSSSETDAANAEKVFQALAKTFEEATDSVQLSVAEIIEIGRIFHQTAVLYALQSVESEADQEVIKNAARLDWGVLVVVRWASPSTLINTMKCSSSTT